MSEISGCEAMLPALVISGDSAEVDINNDLFGNYRIT
jgi:hypothetical protein